MGCTNGKQYKGKNDFIFKTINQKDEEKDEVSQIISSIKNIVNKLDTYYSKVISENSHLPKKLALLSPSDFLQKLRESDYLTPSQISEIEQRLIVLFNNLSQVINTVSQFLFEHNNTIKQEKRNILLTFIMLYEQTCNQFFSYQREIQLQSCMQSTKGSQKLNRNFSKSNEDCSTQSMMVSTFQSKRLIHE